MKQDASQDGGKWCALQDLNLLQNAIERNRTALRRKPIISDLMSMVFMVFSPNLVQATKNSSFNRMNMWREVIVVCLICPVCHNSDVTTVLGKFSTENLVAGPITSH